MQRNPFILYEPTTQEACFLFASPHSGRDYTAEFKRSSILNELGLRSSEDAFVDHLFAEVVKLGAPLLAAQSPRAFLDLNRAPEEMDPAVVKGAPSSGHNPRIASGLGVIPRVVANGRPIYYGKISLIEAQNRLDSIWHPYHRKLRELQIKTQSQFGQSVLLDCHSMPHEAVRQARTLTGEQPQIVLGDRFGASCSPKVMDLVEAAFKQQGFVVARNSPFAGAYTVQQYGRPARHQHVVQIEIDRSLYMEETKIRPNARYEEFRNRITKALEIIINTGRSIQTVAAE